MKQKMIFIGVFLLIISITLLSGCVGDKVDADQNTKGTAHPYGPDALGPSDVNTIPSPPDINAEADANPPSIPI